MQVNSAAQLGYVQLESSFGTIPNTTGTASVGNANAFRGISLLTTPSKSLINRPDKNSSLSRTAGIGGRKSGNWSISASLAGNGAAGTAPDIGPFLQAAFGKAPAIVAATSVTYSLDDLSPSLAIYNFRKPAAASQQCAFGSVVQRMRVLLGEDVARIEASGPCKWVIDTDQFGTVGADHKGGLTTFPSEPASPVTNGGIAPGFVGTVTLDGQSYGTLRTATIDMDFGRDIPLDVYNNYFGVEPGQTIRTINVEFSIYDDVSANLSSLKRKALANTGVDLIFQHGTIAGNIWTLTIKNVLLEAPQYDDSQRRYVVNFTGQAHATSGTSKDELVLALT